MKPASSPKTILWLSIAAFLSTVFVVIATKFGDLIPYNLPFGSTRDLLTQDQKASTVSLIENHLAKIEQKADTEPLWVLAGQVDIREGSPTYWFGDIGGTGRTPVMYSLDKEGIQHGTVYMARGSRIERVSSLDQLVNRYRIYLVYYADTSAGEAHGVVRTVKTTKDAVTVELLEDPLKTQYNIPTTTPLEVFDSSKLFDLKPGTPSDLKEGDIVILTFVRDTPPNIIAVRKVVREAPRTKLFFGTVTRITRPDKDSLRLTQRAGLRLTELHFVGDPTCLAFNDLLFSLSIMAEQLLPRAMRVHLVGVIEKPVYAVL